jgi:hypothetical protein
MDSGVYCNMGAPGDVGLWDRGHFEDIEADRAEVGTCWVDEEEEEEPADVDELCSQVGVVEDAAEVDPAERGGYDAA